MTARTLIVMRHAKAGELPGGPDTERALRPRGQRDAAAAGTWLAEQGFAPELVLCSPARRTRQTWQHVSETLSGSGPGRPGPEFRVDQRLYQAGGEDLLEIIAGVAPEVTSLMYIGHNPAAADLAALLAGADVPFPTSAIAALGLRARWDELADPVAAAGAGELMASWAPRDGG
jgi:phosphohistidine phosphatase